VEESTGLLTRLEAATADDTGVGVEVIVCGGAVMVSNLRGPAAGVTVRTETTPGRTWTKTLVVVAWAVVVEFAVRVDVAVFVWVAVAVFVSVVETVAVAVVETVAVVVWVAVTVEETVSVDEMVWVAVTVTSAPTAKAGVWLSRTKTSSGMATMSSDRSTAVIDRFTLIPLVDDDSGDGRQKHSTTATTKVSTFGRRIMLKLSQQGTAH
jgi:hypothetical protein